MGRRELYSDTKHLVSDARATGTGNAVTLATADLARCRGAIISIALKGDFSIANGAVAITLQDSDQSNAGFANVTDADLYGFEASDLAGINGDHTAAALVIHGAYTGIKRYVRLGIDPGTAQATNGVVSVTVLGTHTLETQRPA